MLSSGGPKKPLTQRELLLREAREYISHITGSAPVYEQNRIQTMYEQLQFISDEKEELISIDFSLEHKKKNETLSLSLKKYKRFEDLPDAELPLYISLLKQELMNIISPLKNALTREMMTAHQFLLSLEDKEYYKSFREEINAKIRKYAFSWASLQDFKKFNQNLSAVKKRLDEDLVTRKKIATDKLESLTTEAQKFNDTRTNGLLIQLNEDSKKSDMTLQEMGDLEDGIALVERRINTLKKKLATTASIISVDPPGLNSSVSGSQISMPKPNLTSESTTAPENRTAGLSPQLLHNQGSNETDPPSKQPLTIALEPKSKTSEKSNPQESFKRNNSYSFALDHLFSFFSRPNPSFLPFPNTESELHPAENKWKEAATPATILKIIQDTNYWSTKTALMPKGIRDMRDELINKSSSDEATKFAAMKLIAAARQWWPHWFYNLTTRDNETQYLYDILCSKAPTFHQDKKFQKLYTDWFNYNNPSNDLKKKDSLKRLSLHARFLVDSR